MPAATTEFDSPQQAGETIRFTVPSGLTFYAGTMAAFNTSTNAVVKATDAANVKVTGRVEKTKTETEVMPVSRLPFWVKNSGTSALAAADFGDVAYVEDDTTVAKVTTNSAPAGKVLAVQTVNGQSYVLIDPRSNF